MLVTEIRPIPETPHANRVPDLTAALPATSSRPRRLSRRQALQVAGGATVLLVGGTLGRAYDQGVFDGGDGPAYDPWRSWQPNGARTPEAMIGAAVLAANPHNTQPWLFRQQATVIDLHMDPARRTGAMDVLDREWWIGAGCALENLALAARAAGYQPAVAYQPDASQPALAARVTLAEGQPATSELYRAIASRHTNRGAFDRTRTVGAGVFDALDALVDEPGVAVHWLRTEDERRRFGDLTVDATHAFIADTEQSEAAFAWFRGSWRDVERYRDGLTIDTQGLSPLMAGIGKVLPTSRAQGDDFWLQNTRDVHVSTAAAFGLLVVPTAEPGQWLRAGRVWQRLHLWGTAHGLAMQPLDQTVQRAEREAQLGLEPRIGSRLAELVDGDGRRAALPFRLGYSVRDGAPSPRRSVSDVLVA